jgi:tRNA dimethylallyltransferase
LQAKNKTVIIIAGPTAVGKTAVAIEIAKHFKTRIISADSRQCFKELCIGVARPSVEELAQVTHYFIASHSIHEKVTAAIFEKYALQKAEEIFLQNDIAVMVGGTGLYIQAFCESLDAIPVVPQEIHDNVIAGYKKNGLSWLQQEIKNADPLFFKRGEMQNPQRLMRALEVVQATGQSIISFHQTEIESRPFNIIKIALEVQREVLYERINHRVDIMMEQGLIEEVRNLIPYQNLNALQTVGYRELFEHFNDDIPLQEAIEKIKTATRHYAKRQLTWFKKDKKFAWCQRNAKEVFDIVERNFK